MGFDKRYIPQLVWLMGCLALLVYVMINMMANGPTMTHIIYVLIVGVLVFAEKIIFKVKEVKS